VVVWHVRHMEYGISSRVIVLPTSAIAQVDKYTDTHSSVLLH
jgi:hypothetical protein